MPTITLQVGQCGNQLGNTLWSLLQRQQEQLANGLLAREWFSQHCSSSSSSSEEPMLQPRVISIDSELKVARSWHSSSPHQLQILGHGGCGNNWACGYHFGVSSCQQQTVAGWSASSQDAATPVQMVMEGIRKEAESAAGVPDFLLLGSLAGGTGSGTGSALLEALAAEYPASTVAAVAVAPGHTGDSTVQSINSCLALQHLSDYAHAVVLLDNQALLNTLNSSQHHNTAASSSSSKASSGSVHQYAQKVGTTAQGSQPGKFCLAGVNRLASEALLGLLWPCSEEDALSGNSNIRQLASTVCADPLTKFVEVCSLSQSVAWNSSSTTLNNSWPERIRLLSSQLPRFDPRHPTQPVTTSAALLLTRGMPGTPAAAAAAATQPGTVVRPNSFELQRPSCWYSPACCWAGYGQSASNCASTSGRDAGWQQLLCGSVCSSWPGFTGGLTDVHLGSSAVMLQGRPSLAAAVRRSSIGSLMRAAADRSLQLCQAGAYLHWYQQYGCSRSDIEAASNAVEDLAAAYTS